MKYEIQIQGGPLLMNGDITPVNGIIDDYLGLQPL